jgi:hypothetical protein
MYYSYVANFKLMMIKHTEETINCITKRKLCHGTECTKLEGKKNTITKKRKFSMKRILLVEAVVFQSQVSKGTGVCARKTLKVTLPLPARQHALRH